MSENQDYNRLCSKCIGDAAFSQWIKNNGERGLCDYDESHGKKNFVVSIDVFAEHVDEYFRNKYCFGGQEIINGPDIDFDQYGDSYKEILENDLECSSELVEEMAYYLPDDDGRSGGEPFYDDCQNYELITVAAEREDARQREEAEWEEHWYQERFAYKWDDFCNTVKYKRRFFKTIDVLTDLLGKAEEYEVGKIKPIYMLKADTPIFRARLLNDTFTREKLDSDPARLLSAPPSIETRPGRMNVEFIPVFYGSFSRETALAEIRPSIGDTLAIGLYLLTRPLKVFDFTAFDNLDKVKGLHDEEISRIYSHTRYEVIQHAQSQISRPIAQDKRQLEYIPTQIIAEYLSEHFGCDAVIFKSSLFETHTSSERNIVIFNKGTEFVAEGNALLRYVSHQLKSVDNVTYQVSDADWF